MVSSPIVLSKLISRLTGRYDEFAKDKFSAEISRLRRHIQASIIHEEEVKSWSPLLVVQFIVGMDFHESLPNLCRFSTSCDRSFPLL